MRLVELKKWKTLTLLVSILCLASCAKQIEPSLPYDSSPMQNRPSVADGPTIPVPEFTIRIVLTQAAAQKLADSGETIKGKIFFDGDGTPLPHEHTAPFRDVYLGSYEFELRESGEVRVSNAIISQEAYNRLSDRNYYFLVNIFSGRRHFQNNVLDGGLAVGRLADLNPEKPIEIQCDLL